MQNEEGLGESELFVMATLKKVAGRITGAELKAVTLDAGEGDEGEDGAIRKFLLQETCLTRSAGDITLRGTVRAAREINKRWETGLVTGSVFVNPDYPVNFQGENGVVTAV